MNANLARKTLGDRWKNSIFYGIGLVAYTFLLVSIFPSFQNFPQVEQFTENYPEELLRFFGSGELDFTQFGSYMNIEFLGLMMVIIMGAYVFTFARSITAGEVKEGTIELLVTQPVERWEIVATKSAVMLAGITALLTATVVSIMAFGSMFGIEMSYSGFASYLPLAIALFVCIAGYSLLLTVIIPKGGTMAAVGLTIAFYVLNFIGESVSSVSWVKFASIFHYYDVGGVLESGTVPWLDILVLAGVGAAALAASAYLFQHRDLTL